MHCRAVDGFGESTQSWRELLLDLKRRGLKLDPKLAIGPSRRLHAIAFRAMDRALGFWTALREVFPTTREQGCRLHKTMNVLNGRPRCAIGSSNQWTTPKSVQAKSKAHLHDIR